MSKSKQPLPTMDDIVAYLNNNSGKVGKREIARAFNVRGDDRVKLKEMLKSHTDCTHFLGFFLIFITIVTFAPFKAHLLTFVNIFGGYILKAPVKQLETVDIITL